ncbi:MULTISPECIES: hypothetical protein [Microbacterium]|uniref:hypothetical protein n=1 Tax=Microbacterium TaxID=33882 RepID=UPI00277E6686|nr:MULTISPECIES: hypothetical protein [Microbacterium]MDQ1075079.1 hypothetical protein [Microbacterium sp. SORGH_AS_0969]MDQ1115310.1 hypothetical protein [Microbacterium testaceum]
MHIFLSDESLAVEATMSDRESDKLYDALERIAADVDEAKADPRNRFISSRSWWSTHIPGTVYTAFWFSDDMLRVILVANENDYPH